MSNHLHKKALVVALGLAIGSTAMAATPAAGSANTAVVSHAAHLRNGDRVTGSVALAKPMHVTISLKLRNKAGLDAFVADPHHPNLTPAEFKARFGPTDAQVARVKAFMRRQGFTNITASSNGLLVSGDAPASRVQAAFHTQMVEVRTADGRQAFANSADVRIPLALQGIVHEVLGLDTVHRLQLLGSVQAEATGSKVSHDPVDLATIYEAGNTATGSTVDAAVITVGSMTNVQADFQTYLGQHPELGSIPLHVVTVNGGSTTTSGDGEWDMDTQAIAGLSGGVKSIYLYASPDFYVHNLVDAFNQAVSDDVARVINVSLGTCETNVVTNGVATGDDVFEQAVAQGQTFTVSSGDRGADMCKNGGTTTGWPANSQYVVAVGGTTLYTDGNTWSDETVWNDFDIGNGATGGGVSAFEPMPAWQQGVGQNAGHDTRGVPDISFTGSPYTGAYVIVHGSRIRFGGTSLSAPMFAGVWARALAINPSLGFAAPLIYQDAASHYATDFHDVTSGNNDGHTAAPGWDYTTGFGSIRIANFVDHVTSGGSPSPAGQTFSSNRAYAIGDDAKVLSPITVAGVSGKAPSDLSVHVDITHSWSGDLEIVLLAPSGAYAILQYPDYRNHGNIDKTYTVNASSVTANGTWKLEVIDFSPGWTDSGTLNGWSMAF